MTAPGMEDYKYEGMQVPMEEIRVLHFSVGTQIPAIRNATFKIFTPGLVENAEKILSIERTTETYGSHERHKLDIFQAPKEDPAAPILVFFYGGGLIRGDRTIEAVPKGLVYHNLGTFFASRGITTVIPDYRRVNSPVGGEDAVFPSGGEDVSLVLKWLETSPLLGNRKRDVILLGNSAGALHVATFLLENSFLEQRKQYLNANKGYLQGAKEYVAGSNGISVTGAVLSSMPAHFEEAAKDRKDMLREYYGSEDKAAEQCPAGLLRELSKSTPSLVEAGLPKTLALLGEYDPPDEIGKPMEDFVTLWKGTFDGGIELQILEGHNHISPIAALMSGDEKGDKWGEDVVSWVLGRKVKVHKDAECIKRGPKLGKKADEDGSTEQAAEVDGEDRKSEKKNPSEDTSTQEAAKHDEKNGNIGKADPTEDFSTDKATQAEKKGKAGKADPSEDFSTDNAATRNEKKANAGTADPTEDDSGKELM